MSDSITKAATALGIDPVELKKNILTEMLGKDATAPTLEEKVDTLSKEIADLKSASATTDAEKAAAEKAKAGDNAPPFMSDKEKEEFEKYKAQKKAADEKEEFEKYKAQKSGAEKTDAEKAEAAKKAEAEATEKRDSVEKALPWPADCASKDFRSGSVQKTDPSRDFSPSAE